LVPAAEFWTTAEPVFGAVTLAAAVVSALGATGATVVEVVLVPAVIVGLATGETTVVAVGLTTEGTALEVTSETVPLTETQRG
jgi:ribose/xylose/arabinose/galactoside ABC-type transport system permease subunit